MDELTQAIRDLDVAITRVREARGESGRMWDESRERYARRVAAVKEAPRA